MLSNNLKTLRKLNDWIQDDVAKKLEIGTSKYQSYEDGRAEPNIETLIKIADLYGITVDQLIRDRIKIGIK